MSDDAKKAILARRAKFVAAAVASIGIACGKDPAPPPQPCLSEPYHPPDAEPMPCLTPVVAPVDAGTDAAKDEKDAASPLPCLSPPIRPTDAGKPQPTVCLKIAPPKTSP